MTYLTYKYMTNKYKDIKIKCNPSKQGSTTSFRYHSDNINNNNFKRYTKDLTIGLLTLALFPSVILSQNYIKTWFNEYI